MAESLPGHGSGQPRVIRGEPYPRLRPPAAAVPDEVIADQDCEADGAKEEDQCPDCVQIRHDQPERAEDQPEQDDQGDCSYVPAAHITDAPLGERCGRFHVYPERGRGTPSATAVQPRCGDDRTEDVR